MARLFSAAHQLSELEAVHARHLDIKNSQRKFVLEQQGQRFFAAGGLKNGSSGTANNGF